jgi:beta-lactamase class A
VNAAGQWLVFLLLVGAVVAISLGLGPLRSMFDAAHDLAAGRPSAVGERVPTTYADSDLQARVEAAAHIEHGAIAAVVVDLARGATASINPDRSFPAASLFKLPILVEVLAQESSGRLPADRELQIGQDDWTAGSGVLQARVGERLPVRELRRLMIQESDNIAALVLLDAVGAASVNRRLEVLELRGTRVVDFRGGERGEHITTAADMARLLTLMAQGRLVDARVSEEARALLELRQAHTWLAEGLPWWVKVAHKWGDLPEARHDVGVVFTPNGNYLSAVLTEEVDADEAQRAITRVSHAAYDRLR